MTRFRGIVCVAISAILFGCMPLMAKKIYLCGGNPVNLAFNRFVFSLPILFLLMKRFSDNIYINPRQILKVFILSLGFSGTSILLMSSYNYISSFTATTIHFIYPTIVILMDVIIFREKIKPVKYICAILCTIGIMLFYTPDQSGNIIGIIFALTSGITYAFYIVYLDKSNIEELPAFKLAFYLSLISSIELFLFSFATNKLTFNIKPSGWILTIVFSILISTGATTLFQIGVKIIGDQQASILSTFEPITSMILGVLVFKEMLNMKIFTGVFFVILSIILITMFDRSTDKITLK
ncbi:EamA/RhaT family transporter [Acidilutibacter cellobiosedens]|jgi:drug/metabolite transporter (DMT)-like permease|uniref:EamA/RhaT family transporter n=1 Tax=Acidilutibacter cellobiosedens TaxID=2507161 RepID=A0A410Q943_9FIRM|nr:DMT family transporter [Acidilutibacter cellobiosedens]MBE6083299.1 EamA/RhaT family transporter [Tissierellaceae bacterium]QAT60476.1 EamA/RhaT family transporter [Acidilutibacter cellobiosedens]